MCGRPGPSDSVQTLSAVGEDGPRNSDPIVAGSSRNKPHGVMVSSGSPYEMNASEPGSGPRNNTLPLRPDWIGPSCCRCVVTFVSTAGSSR